MAECTPSSCMYKLYPFNIYSSLFTFFIMLVTATHHASQKCTEEKGTPVKELDLTGLDGLPSSLKMYYEQPLTSFVQNLDQDILFAPPCLTNRSKNPCGKNFIRCIFLSTIHPSIFVHGFALFDTFIVYATKTISHPFPDGENFIQFSLWFFPNIAVIHLMSFHNKCLQSVANAITFGVIAGAISSATAAFCQYLYEGRIVLPFPYSLVQKIGTTLDLTKHYADIFGNFFDLFLIRNLIQVHGFGCNGRIVFLLTQASTILMALCLLA